MLIVLGWKVWWFVIVVLFLFIELSAGPLFVTKQVECKQGCTSTRGMEFILVQ